MAFVSMKSVESIMRLVCWDYFLVELGTSFNFRDQLVHFVDPY